MNKEFKKGTKIVVVKNLGPENYHNPGDREEYYYEGQTISDLPLNSKGKVLKVERNIVYAEINGMTCLFHEAELEIIKEEPAKNNKLLKFPSQLFALADKMPVFLLNDRLYILEETSEELEKDFYCMNKDKKETKFKLVESASLKSLEELTENHFSKELKKLKKKCIEEFIEEEKKDEHKYKIVDFIVNKIFPHLRTGEINKPKIDNLLEVKITDDKSKCSEKFSKENSEKEIFIAELINKIEKETLLKKTKKNKLPKTYEPESLIGNILKGKNVAIINGSVYYLEETKNTKKLNFLGKNYRLVEPHSFEQLKEEFNFELSKKIRIEALKTKTEKDKQIRELLAKNSNLESLVMKSEYKEEDFGFKKINEDYFVFLKVPQHVLKEPEYRMTGSLDNVGRLITIKKENPCYYLFDEVKIYVRVSFGKNFADLNNAITLEAYSHPFSYHEGNRGFCLGKYDYNALRNLEKGLAMATILKDTKRTLLSGHINENTRPLNPIENFYERKITLEEIKKRNLQITNLNIKKGHS